MIPILLILAIVLVILTMARAINPRLGYGLVFICLFVAAVIDFGWIEQ